MKIENQVCSLEQAKKLKELGIVQTETSYVWVSRYDGESFLTYYDAGDSVIPQYSAFTVAELGVMLPREFRLPNEGICHLTFSNRLDFGAFTRIKNWGTQTIIHTIEGDTEAQSRANMLIWLLESNHITATEVNNRLKNS